MNSSRIACSFRSFLRTDRSSAVRGFINPASLRCQCLGGKTMRRKAGFSLIELMVTVVVVAILAAIAYPSYQRHVLRGIRSQGQQFLMDVAQRQEQYMLDQRSYATQLAAGAGGLGMAVPDDVARRYQAPAFAVNNAGTPPSFQISLAPITGGAADGDGTLVIDNLSRRWRETDGNLTFGTNDCRWEDSSCTPS
jgi:type IV pilus assembly protein PilE